MQVIKTKANDSFDNLGVTDLHMWYSNSRLTNQIPVYSNITQLSEQCIISLNLHVNRWHMYTLLVIRTSSFQLTTWNMGSFCNSAFITMRNAMLYI